MASMLAFGYTADEVATVYEKFAPKVFTYCMFDCWWYIGNVFRSKYRSDNMVAAADALFSGHTYEVLVGTCPILAVCASLSVPPDAACIARTSRSTSSPSRWT